MSPTGLAVFVFFAFLVPVPVLVWLDAPRSGDAPDSSRDGGRTSGRGG